MRDRYAVAVIGAGPNGLVLANLLGAAGIDTLLVEANAATVGEPRAVSIDDETLRVVQQIGLLGPVSRDIVSGYGSDYLGPDRSRFLRVKPVARPYGHPRRNAFRQPVFEAQLREGLARHASVDARFETRLIEHRQDAAEVRLTVAGPDDARRTIRADFLVACDGARSGVREALGAALSGDSMDERWLIVDLERSPAASPETIVFCDPARPAIMLPGPRDTRRFEFKLHRGESEAAMLKPDVIADPFQRHGVDPATPVRRCTVYHFHARIADRWGMGRVWLAGDAAHLMPPFAGQGMNGGVRDAANLAWKLIAIARGQLGPRLLDSYEVERRAHVAQMIRLALRMGAIFAPRTRLHGVAARAAFRALGVWPAARRWFAEMRYKPPPRFDGGFLLTAQLTRRGIVGRMLPQPDLPLRLGAEARFDDLLGRGFALVGVDLAPEVVAAASLGAKGDRLIEARPAVRSADLPPLAPHAGHLLLVRPDRYVMASATPATFAAVRPDLDRLVEATWPDGPSARPQRVNR